MQLSSPRERVTVFKSINAFKTACIAMQVGDGYREKDNAVNNCTAHVGYCVVSSVIALII